MGLSISKQFVDLMGGKISVKDNQGGGSIFYFSLPYSLPENIENEAITLDDSVISNEKILIVDDLLSAAESFKKKLEQLGFSAVDFVLSGEESLKKLCEAAEAQKPYTQVFIDMIMPKMDGWRLSSEINNNPLINNTKLYLLIPEGQMGRDAKMKRLKWFNGYLYKPIRKKQLLNLLIANAEQTLELEAVEDETDVLIEQKNIEEKSNISSNNSEKKAKDSSDYKMIAKNRSIIIAEDHLVNQKLICRFFQQFGAETICVNNGEEATDVVLLNPNVDLIFMDIQMPVMSGVEATQKIRSSGINIPIIACTANTDESDFEEYYKAGMNDILIKPFKKQTVYELLKKWIAKLEKDTDLLMQNLQSANKQDSYNPVVWDVAEMLVATSNNKAVVKQKITDFISRTVSLFEKLTEAVQTSNFLEIQHCSYLLSSNASAVAVNKLSDAARQMELVSKAKNIQTCKLCLDECVAYFEEFNKIAEDWIETND